jgi:hypothetical protein
MDDAYESAHGLDPADAADALLDSDGDGVSNRDEYRSGTDVNDPDSFLKIMIASPGATLHFRAVAGRSYSILHRNQPDAGAWQKLADIDLETVDRDLSIPDAEAPSNDRRYYRLVTPMLAVP